jgi:Putative zinc ribbon domain
MDEEPRCQSCGMPLTDDPDNYGTYVDGTRNDEYCAFCYESGAFTMPDLDVEDMIGMSIDHMTTHLALSTDEAEVAARESITTLKRWRS